MSDFDGTIAPAAGWEDIPRLSTEALLRGGSTGSLNAQAAAIAARLNFLKSQVDGALLDLSAILAAASSAQDAADAAEVVATAAQAAVVAATDAAEAAEAQAVLAQDQASNAMAAANGVATQIAALGTAATKNAGVSAGQVLLLTETNKLPAMNASNLTDIDASASEISAESAVGKFVRPDRIKSSRRVAKAWANFDGTLSGTITPRAHFNVSSVTKNGTGDYTLNFSTAMADSNYSAAGMVRRSTSSSDAIPRINSNASPSTTSLRIITATSGNSTVDADIIAINIFGN